MRRVVYLLIAFLAISFLLVALTQAEGKTAVSFYDPAPFAAIPISRQANSDIDVKILGVFGPHICVAYGDPFSPLNSPYEPGPYTYQFLIRIPADYSHDLLRVELFDPDSINAPSANPYTIVRTSTAVNAGLSPTKVSSCLGSQLDPCTLNTDEADLYQSELAPLEPLNPFWFVRIDEHRGAGAPPGNGSCGNPGSYNPAYNTQTTFELAYMRQNGMGGAERVSLATYTGQVGDGVRDNGGHLTDLHWVSPGADTQGPDYPLADTPGVSEVPVDPGSQTSFVLDLDTDLPGIVTDAATGERIIYLDVITLSGASENVFHIWAGPNSDLAFLPAHVNARNIAVSDTPGLHDSAGVTVAANGRLPVNNLFTSPIAWPIADLPADFAGGALTIASYDLDSGAQPPLTFFFEGIAEEDWARTFGQPGVDDPDGVPAGTRCLPGSCNALWVESPYEMVIPGGGSDCDGAEPGDAACIPFNGGHLLMRVNGGVHDTAVWEVRAAPADIVYHYLYLPSVQRE